MLLSAATAPEVLQEQRRQELTAYLEELKQQHGTTPQDAELTFGASFYGLVQQFTQQRKSEYESNRGVALLLHFFCFASGQGAAAVS